MDKTTKNIVIILGIITTVFALYYVLTQGAALTLDQSESDQQLQELLTAAQTFSERQRALDAIELDVTIFDDETFRSLRSFSTEPLQYNVGRDNPFLPPENVTPLTATVATDELE